MSALDEYLNDEKYAPDLYDDYGWKLLDQARAELAQLRADLQAAQARIAEQARKLEEARTIIQFLRNGKNGTLRNAAKNWLAANPAPDAEPQPPNGEGRP